MKKIIQTIICIGLFTFCYAQQSDTSGNTNDTFIIINNEEIITNKMIFYPPYAFRKNKKPLFLVNGKEVYTVTYYNRDEFKRITVLQPKEGVTRFGKKGKNGAIIVDLRDNVKEPEIEILTNRVYYKCKINGKLTDTLEEYYYKVNGENCSILDLRNSSKTPTLYSNFNNEIKIKNLGVGWDMTSIYVSGGTFSGTGTNRIVFVQKEGTVKITIVTCEAIENCKQKEITFSAIAIPIANQ